MKNNLGIKVDANLTKPINDITSNVILPPAGEISTGITKLLGVVTTFIDNATYKYIENSKYKKEKFLKDLEEKYNKIPCDNIIDPDISILGTTLDALKYNLDKEYIVDLYTNILISDMDNRTKNDVHISYVEMLKQMSKDDLILLEKIYKSDNFIAIGKGKIVDETGRQLAYNFSTPLYIANIKDYLIENVDSFSSSIENLKRLGLIELSFLQTLSNDEFYNEIRKHGKQFFENDFMELKMNEPTINFDIDNGMLYITNLGYNLMKVCLRDI